MKNLFKKIIIKILILESKLVLKKYKPSIITVTGSVGKTSTKDAIYTVLAKTGYIRKSEKSFNSDIGIPLTILGCKNGWNDPFLWLKNIFFGIELIMFKSEYPECLVLEVGTDRPGDITRMTSWLRSDIAVITKVSEIPVHVEFFKTPEDLFVEKLSLVKCLKDEGVLIVSADDRRLLAASLKVKQKVMTFSIDNLSTVSASEVELDPDIGIIFKLKFDDVKYEVKIGGVLGNQQIYPIIAAVTVGLAKNIPILDIIGSLKNHIAPRGRMNIIAGINGSTIIDDTYNSSPDALHEALATLEKVKTNGKKIAVLGDMMELGKFSADEHRKAGERAIRACDILLTVGPRARQMSSNAIHFDSSVDAGEYLRSIVGQGDIVLIKGSQFVRLEKATKAILAEPDRASELLVRQDAEWLAKK
jgi:UDP-N-acetylmuramoyl-tripeptide--D-alanyl-D-alanine ligase